LNKEEEIDIDLKALARQKAVAELIRNNPDELERYLDKYLMLLRGEKDGRKARNDP
jgi:hypothetical protein